MRTMTPTVKMASRKKILQPSPMTVLPQISRYQGGKILEVIILKYIPLIILAIASLKMAKTVMALISMSPQRRMRRTLHYQATVMKTRLASRIPIPTTGWSKLEE